MSLKAGYATEPQKIRIEYKSEYTELIKDWHINLDAGLNELKYTHFYGLGNERILEADVESDFYRVGTEFFNFNLGMDHYINSNIKININSSFRNSTMKNDENSIIGVDDFIGEKGISQVSLGVGAEYDSRDGEDFAKDGIYASTHVTHSSSFLSNNNAFTKLKFDGRFYFTPEIFPITFAQRIFGEKLWGKYNIFDAAILGGSSILRGFVRERFSGDAAVMVASEVRMPIAKLRVIIPGVVGFSAHAETGRVYYSGDNSSDKWHPSLGGGLWVSYLKESIILNFTISHSNESDQMYITTGFMF